ncbi:hypothetical protein [Micromonospora sp. LOL_023]|uniref:hypothetical protein n=1 Tax=Micromonospora sp. LOL_023 TaxID=3345418 RepID=UPI003A898CC9
MSGASVTGSAGDAVSWVGSDTGQEGNEQRQVSDVDRAGAATGGGSTGAADRVGWSGGEGAAAAADAQAAVEVGGRSSSDAATVSGPGDAEAGPVDRNGLTGGVQPAEQAADVTGLRQSGQEEVATRDDSAAGRTERPVVGVSGGGALAAQIVDAGQRPADSSTRAESSPRGTGATAVPTVETTPSPIADAVPSSNVPTTSAQTTAPVDHVVAGTPERISGATANMRYGLDDISQARGSALDAVAADADGGTARTARVDAARASFQPTMDSRARAAADPVRSLPQRQAELRDVMQQVDQARRQIKQVIGEDLARSASDQTAPRSADAMGADPQMRQLTESSDIAAVPQQHEPGYPDEPDSHADEVQVVQALSTAQTRHTAADEIGHRVAFQALAARNGRPDENLPNLYLAARVDAVRSPSLRDEARRLLDAGWREQLARAPDVPVLLPGGPPDAEEVREDVRLRQIGHRDAVASSTMASPSDRPGVLFDVAATPRDDGESLAVLAEMVAAEMVAAEAANATDPNSVEARARDFTVSLLALLDQLKDGRSGPAEVEAFVTAGYEPLAPDFKLAFLDAIGTYHGSLHTDAEKAGVAEIAAAVMRCE